jgi:hypothetical protein
LEEC